MIIRLISYIFYVLKFANLPNLKYITIYTKHIVTINYTQCLIIRMRRSQILENM